MDRPLLKKREGKLIHGQVKGCRILKIAGRQVAV